MQSDGLAHLLRERRGRDGQHVGDRTQAVSLLAGVQRVCRIGAARETSPRREVGRRCVGLKETMQRRKLLLPVVQQDGAVERHRSCLFVQRFPELDAIVLAAASPE